MKKLFALSAITFLLSCDSTQKGEINYTDSAEQKSDTTTIPYTTAPGDSTRPDSTVKDSLK